MGVGFITSHGYRHGGTPMIIRSKAPLRISFGGGGTDVPPYPEERGGVTLNTTINKYAYATLVPSTDGEIKVTSLAGEDTDKVINTVG